MWHYKACFYFYVLFNPFKVCYEHLQPCLHFSILKNKGARVMLHFTPFKMKSHFLFFMHGEPLQKWRTFFKCDLHYSFLSKMCVSFNSWSNFYKFGTNEKILRIYTYKMKLISNIFKILKIIAKKREDTL